MTLTNQHVVLTRSTAGNRKWTASFTSRGINIYEFPTIETHPLDLTPELKQTLGRLNQFDWLIFTSVAGVRYTESLLAKLSEKLIDIKMPSVAAIGEKTSAAIRKAGMHVAFQPSSVDGATLAAELTPVKAQNILLLRTAIASTELATILRQRNASVTDLAVYTTRLRTDNDPRFSRLLQSGKIGFLTFASPSAVRGFSQRLSPVDFQIAQTLPAIAIGASVAIELNASEFRHVHIASKPTAEAIIESILELSRHIT